MNEIHKKIGEAVKLYLNERNEEAKTFVLETVQTLKPNEIIDDLFFTLVGDSGKADTIAGELIRAVNRIGFRWFNDGDVYFDGYGLETAGADAVYIAEHTNQLIKSMILDTFPEQYVYRQSDTSVNNFIKLLKTRVGQYIIANPTTMLSRNTIDSRSQYADEAIYHFEAYDEYLNGDED